MSIDGHVVVITGASSGIGESLARLAHERGATVVLAARRQDRLDALSAELGGALAVKTDVTDPAQLQALFDTTVGKHGRIDVLVNNAGRGMTVPIADLSAESLRQITEINLIAPTVAISLIVPIMREQGAGTIVNVSSDTTRLNITIPGTGAYVGIKSAINKISEVARVELAGDGITVSLFMPSLTATELFEAEDRADGPGAGPPPGMQFDSPANVAGKMIELIESGEPELVMTPAGVAAAAPSDTTVY